MREIAQKALDVQPNGIARPDIAGGELSADSGELGSWLDRAKGRGFTLALVSGGYVENPGALWDHYEANQDAINGYFAEIDNGQLLRTAFETVPGQRGAYFALGLAAGALGTYLLTRTTKKK